MTCLAHIFAAILHLLAFFVFSFNTHNQTSAIPLYINKLHTFLLSFYVYIFFAFSAQQTMEDSTAVTSPEEQIQVDEPLVQDTQQQQQQLEEPKQTSWWHTISISIGCFFITVATVLGTGILALPYVYSKYFIF